MKWLIAIWFLAVATPVEAAPVFAAIGSMFATIGGAIGGALAGSTVLQFLAKTVLSIGLSALARAKAGKQRPAGIATEVTTSGGVTSQKIILGKYATAGQWMAPPNSYGSSGGTPSAYLVYAIALSAVPGVTLSRVILNDAYVDLGAPGANWGRPVQGDLAGYAWIDFKDGSQTVAHPDLLASFSADPDRPWAANMVAPGTAYLVGRFLYNRERFNGLVSIMAEMVGIPLYDPRKDSTAGGSGSQRWANKATWTQTLNPVVMIYNILRGIRIDIAAGVIDVWGGECEADDLPFANWAAAMNECDLEVPKPGGGTEPQFRAGIEIALAEDQPIDIIRELAKTCSAQLCEIGGVWKIRVGGVGMPIFTFYDDDIVVTSDEEFNPFPGLSATWNGISATYPDPESLWQLAEAPPRFNAAWEAEDGGRRLTAELPLPACPFDAQVQRVMNGYVNDERRFRRQRVPLPPEAAVLEPLDAVAFTSGTYSYDAKVFEITGMVDHLMSVRQTVNMRERDPADYEVDPGSYLPINRPPVTVTQPAVQGVPGWGLTAEMIADAGGAGRRPGIRPVWSAEAALDARGIRWELRYVGKPTAHLKGLYAGVDEGTMLIGDGILPNADYEGRARFVTRRKTVWSGWVSVHTHNVRLGAPDLADDINDAIADGVAALLEADSVRSDHDALVSGFTGDLATAFAEQSARSMATAGGWLRDPTFTDWTGGNLTAANWSSRSGTSVYAIEAGGDFGGGITINVPSGAAVVEMVASNAVGLRRPDAVSDYATLDLDLEYIAGNPAGTAWRVEWSNDGTTWTRGTFAGVAAAIGNGSAYGLTPQPGARQSIRGLWKRPAGVSGHIRMRLIAKLSTVTDAQEMVIHYANLRRATKAEIDAGETYLIASATPGTTVAYTGAGAAIAGLSSAFTVRAGDLEGSVTNIMGVRADLMAGTALAALLTQLSVSTATGNSAWVTTQGAAVADLEDKVSASYVLRVGAGGAAAGLELVAQDDAVSGAASTVKINANTIGLYGDVTVSAGNLFPDYDMAQPGFYSTTTAAAYSFIATTSQLLGGKYLSVDATGASENVFTGWFPIEPNTEYLVRGGAWMATNTAGSGQIILYVQTGEADAAGVKTLLTTTTVKNVTDTGFGSGSFAEVSFTSDATARWARFRINRVAGGTAAGRVGGFRVEKKNGADLILDGAMKARHVDTVDFSAAGVSIFGGMLKSSNYVAGVSGWRLSHSGTLEIRNLIDRSALTAAAASDRTQSTMLTEISVPVATANIILTHTVGPVAYGNYILRAVAFEARNVQAGDTVFDLQVRRKQYGVWGTWEVLTTWTIPGGTAVWDVYSSGSYLVGSYDDVQYRVRSTRAGVASNGIRNLYITTQNTVV